MTKVGYIQLCGLFAKQVADVCSYEVVERTVRAHVRVEGFSAAIEFSRLPSGDEFELALCVTDSVAVYYHIPFADTNRYQSVAEAFLAYDGAIKDHWSRQAKTNECFNRLVKLIGEIYIPNAVDRKEGIYYTNAFGHFEASVLKDRVAVYDKSADDVVELLLDVDCSKDKTMHEALSSLLSVRHNHCIRHIEIVASTYDQTSADVQAGDYCRAVSGCSHMVVTNHES